MSSINSLDFSRTFIHVHRAREMDLVTTLKLAPTVFNPLLPQINENTKLEKFSTAAKDDDSTTKTSTKQMKKSWFQKVLCNDVMVMAMYNASTVRQ